MKNIKFLFFALIVAIVFISGCKKKFDLPPEQIQPANTGSLTIDSLRKKYAAHYITFTVSPTKLFRFADDVTLTCTVTADETSGNIYKGVYVEDATGTMLVKLLNSGGLAVGDQIRINLKNIALDDYGKMIQLDSVDIEKSVTKLSSGHMVTPTKMSFNQMMSIDSWGLIKYQGKLVLLDSVEFSAGEKGKTFADTINKFSLDRILQNYSGQQVVVRSSGYSNFARNKIPCGKGSIIALVGEYNGDVQLTIRDFNEVKIANDNCPLLVKGFDDFQTIEHGGWTNYNVTANIDWTIGTYGGRVYGNITSYPSNVACETWLISPPFDITNAPNPKFSFVSAYSYTGLPLQVYVSTNYNSGAPNTASWMLLSPTLSPGGFAWTSSGNISLTAYKSANTRVAFKYSTTGSGSTWEVDDIAIFAQ